MYNIWQNRKELKLTLIELDAKGYSYDKIADYFSELNYYVMPETIRQWFKILGIEKHKGKLKKYNCVKNIKQRFIL